MMTCTCRVSVVCVNQDSGYYMAFGDTEFRGWGQSEESAVVDLLLKLGLEIHGIEKDS